MKCVTLSNEYLSDLLMKLGSFKTDKNKIRFNIGVGNNGNSLACRAIIVANGKMADVGFETSLPQEGFDATANEMYMNFNLSANDFCNYASVLSSYKSDVAISYDGTMVYLSIGDSVEIPLNTVSEENVEPMLVRDFDCSILRARVECKYMLEALKTGAYVAENEVDPRGITDRAALFMTDNECNVYSTDGHLATKASCAANVVFNELLHAKNFLREKGAVLTPPEQEKLYEEMKGCQEDEAAMISLAKTYGFTEYVSHEFGLSASAVDIIQKVFASYEELRFLVTPNNLHIMAGNIFSTFALAGKVSSFYKNTVEDAWSSLDWDTHIVIDKETFNRALSVLKLGDNNSPFNISATDFEVVTIKDGNKISIPIIAGKGKRSDVNVHMSVKYFSQIFSKLSNGNISMRFMTGKNANNTPVMISNGGLDDIPKTCAYVIGVKAPTTSKSDKQE